MDKKESRKAQDIKNPTFENKKVKASTNLSNKKEKKLLVTYLFVLAGFIYFYPVVKYSIKKLDCQTAAKKYILDNKNTKDLNNKQLKMLSTNFCNGGNEIYEIENLND